MRNRTLVAVLLGALALFVWQTISNAVIPWHNATMTMLPMGSALGKAVHANAPVNGLYTVSEGAVVVVSMTPTLEDKSQMMGVPLVRQFVIDLIVCWTLVMMIPRFATGTSATRTFVMGAFAASVCYAVSQWNWFGYPMSWTLVNLVEQLVDFAVAGWVITWWLNRGTAMPAGASDAGVAAGGGLPNAPSGARAGV